MQRLNLASVIRLSRVLSLSLLVAVVGGLPGPEAAVQTVLFCPKTDFGTGSFPVSVAVGDFNGDTKLDLAVANNGGNTVSILPGTGTGSFGPRADFSSGANPVSVAASDFNGDSNLDLAVANQSNDNKVSILLGTGMGGFGASIDFGAGSIPFSVAAGDFNGDHKFDLAVANAGANTVSILLNTTMPGQPLSFAPKTDFNTGSLPCSIAVGDFDHDGKPDLAIANRSSNTVSILLGTGMGAFGAKTDFGTGAGPASVAAGDFNGDSKLDLAVANFNSNTVSILSGTGTGDFGAKADFATGANPRSVAVGDFNGDGKLDLAVANIGSTTVSILLGSGTGSFGAKTDFGAGAGPAAVAAGDLNGDGKLDLAAPNSSSNNVSILLSTCSSQPSITASPVNRSAGNPAMNSQIATVDDAEDARATLTVRVNAGLSATVNGVTVALNPTGPNASGQVFADVVAVCSATTASFTLRVTDSGGLFSEATLTVTVLPPPTPTIFPTSQAFTSSGGASTVNVTSPSCPWTAVSNDPGFITITSGASGTGNGMVSYSVAMNSGPARMGTMTIATQTFTVSQDLGCPFMLSSTSQNFVAAGGMNSVNVTMAAGCTWNAVSNDSFIVINSGTPGSGDGTVTYTVANNTGPVRTGTMTIAGIMFTVTQDAACPFALSSNSQHFLIAGGSDSVNVITGAGCTWTAVSNDAFIMVTGGASGSGNGTVNYSVAGNIGSGRSGTMTIVGITFTVTQDGGCTFTLSRDHQSFAGSGGLGSVNVTASDAACPWTATTAATFIHITSGTPGMGNGTLTYAVDANPGPVIRSDTITIAGHTYTVYQGIDFLDVPLNHVFYTDIGKLASRGVTLGCGSGNYCPNDSVLREQMAAFILRAKGEFSPPNPASQQFADVPPSNVFYNFIDRLAVLQITLGCTPDHSLYCPTDPVKRDQMSAFIVRGLGEFNPPTPVTQRFNDVPSSNVFYNFIDRMAVLNITMGCTPDHLFYCPSDPVSRAQMAAFLVRAFDL